MPDVHRLRDGQPVGVLKPGHHSGDEPAGVLKPGHHSGDEPAGVLKPGHHSAVEPAGVLKPGHHSAVEPDPDRLWIDQRRPEPERKPEPDAEPRGKLTSQTANLASMESLPPVAGPPVFLVPSGELPAETVTLTGPEGHHAAVVRRLRVGERADVSDGAGTLAEGVVASVTKDSVTLAVRSVRAVPAPEPRITVVQALPKGDRGELAVELMSEVGVDSVIAWSAQRCVTRWHGDRGARALGKWQSTAREAAKQSRRAWLPEVTGPATLGDVTKRVSAAARAIVLEADATARLSVMPLPEQGEILLVVGPEGGISPAERAALASTGATEARLGPTVLRTSTAGAAAAAVLLARTPRW